MLAPRRNPFFSAPSRATWPQTVPSKLSYYSHNSWRCDAIWLRWKFVGQLLSWIKQKRKWQGAAAAFGRGRVGKTGHSHAHNSIGSNKSTFNFIYYGRNVRENVSASVSASVNHDASVCLLSFEWTLMNTCLWTDAEISVRYFHCELEKATIWCVCSYRGNVGRP